jgi:hypothetical protein
MVQRNEGKGTAQGGEPCHYPAYNWVNALHHDLPAIWAGHTRRAVQRVIRTH